MPDQPERVIASLAKKPAKEVGEALQSDAVASLSAQRELLPPPFQKVP